MYGHCLQTCLTTAPQIQICATLHGFASFLRHWKLKIPTGTRLCTCTMSGAAQLLTVEPTVARGIRLHGLISMQLQWKWGQLCGSIAGQPPSHSSAMKHRSPHREKRICLPAWEGGQHGLSQGGGEQSSALSWKRARPCAHQAALGSPFLWICLHQ